MEQGARVDIRLYDRLVQHRLREPIEQLPWADRLVDTAALVAPLGTDAAAHIASLASAFAQWERTQQAQAVLAALMHQALDFVDVRLRALQKTLLETGAHPRQQVQLLQQLQGAAAGLAELAFAGRKALWQL